MENSIKLPNDLFEVIVPTVALYTEYDIETNNISSTVLNGEVMPINYNETTRVMINLDKILDIYSNKFGISVVKIDDVGKIADILEKYLLDIERYKSANIFNKIELENNREVEVRKFLKDIYNNNKKYFENRMKSKNSNVFGSGVSEMISSVMAVNKNIKPYDSDINNKNTQSVNNWNKDINKSTTILDTLGTEGPPIIYKSRWPTRSKN